MMRLMYSCAAIALLATSSATPLFAQKDGSKAATTEKMTYADVDCKTAFTKVDADSNGFISKQEAQKALERSFKNLDLDRNGRVSKAEYNACNEYSELYAETNTGADWFRKADADQDRKITKDEMASAAKRSYAADAKGMSEEEHARKTAYDFSRLDTNDNGTLEFSEWKGTPVADDVIPGDANADQSLDFKEWQAHYRESDAKARQASQTAADDGKSKSSISRGMSESQAATAGTDQASRQTKQPGQNAAEGMGEPSVWYYYIYIY